MKLLIALLFLSVVTFAQRPNTPINVADTATPFGVSVPINQLIFNIADSSFYSMKQAATKLQKLSNTLNYKLPSSGGTPDLSNYIQATGGQNVMGQPLVVMGDTVRPLPVGTADGQMLRWNDVAKSWSRADRYILDTVYNAFIHNTKTSPFATDNIATGWGSFIANGNNNVANGVNSFISGTSNLTVGDKSFAVGGNNKSLGAQSVSFGQNNISRATSSITFGSDLISNNNNQLSIGLNNDTTTADVFDVGVGLDSDNRADAFRIGQDSGVYMPLLPPAITPIIAYVDTANDNKLSYGPIPSSGSTSLPIDSVINLQDSLTAKANVAEVATKWTQGGDNVPFPNNYNGTLGNSDYRMGANGRDDIVIDSLPTGNVGIGTNAPTEKLSVNGNLIVTNGVGAGNQIKFTGSNHYIENNSTNDLRISTNQILTFMQGSNRRLIFSSTDLYPFTSTYDLGRSANIYRSIYVTGINGGNIGLCNGTTLAPTSPTYKLSMASGAAATWGIENSSSGAGVKWTLRGSGAATGATDGRGGMFTAAYGKSTGTGFGSFRITRYSRAISTGTADNTESDAMIIPSSKLMADNTSTTLFNVACTTGTSAGLTVEYTIKTVGGAGNESHTEVGRVNIMVANDGAVTVSANKQVVDQLKSDAGTYTITFAATTANPSVISVTADTDLNVNSVIHYNIINKDAQVINQL